VISIPEIPFPAPKDKKDWIFTDNQKKDSPTSTVPKIAATVPGVPLARALFP
jgi:hypothetical protein